ncbi:unnamed protein product [Caenorhabditis sp. 36 PRJEB53466]|nr:unnamed protein product [Caenorhabditis sp. 36 PRJEB53466]
MLTRLLVLTWLLEAATANMSCLVMRPGYGLVSEECPSHAVGCRIRAKKDHIEWYELSRLYDRNQLVCVYPEEYKSMTGCMRKPSGSVRCWCGGRENCNDPETSRDLYEAFTEGDNEAVEKISDWLKSEKDESSWKKFTTTEEVPTTTTRRTTTPRRTTVRRTTTTTTTTQEPTTTSQTITTSTDRPTVTPKKTTKRIGNAKSTSTSKPSMSSKEEPKKARVINIVDIREKAVPLPNDDVSLDDTFEETRKKLEKEMKEEDERLKEMLADEEEEESNDIDEEEDVTAEDQREEERERYRMERRRVEERRLQEDTILRRIEEEEIREAEKDRPNRGTSDDDIYGSDFENSSEADIAAENRSVFNVTFKEYRRLYNECSSLIDCIRSLAHVVYNKDFQLNAENLVLSLEVQCDFFKFKIGKFSQCINEINLDWKQIRNQEESCGLNVLEMLALFKIVKKRCGSDAYQDMKMNAPFVKILICLNAF